MALTAGTRLGPYEILAPIGAGGMGEVYRARDTKLDRDVAIKVLPAALAQDPERLARFEREAKVLASLNHPNIAQIYGIEDRALLMELVQGQTLQGPLSLETALNYARQIADALEAAHEKNIIHRDLKPANIMITPAGVIKVLDFGLAAVAQSSDPSNPANSPTLTISPTRAGMILGTAAYMSPEQARGKAVDKRADIWAFGAVLFEMLTGKRLFEGETVSDTLAQVLTKEPDWEQVPAQARKLVRRCLEKDPKRRLRDVGDARILLEEVPAEVAPDQRGTFWWKIAAAVAVVLAALGGWAVSHFRQPPADERVLRFQIEPPEGAEFSYGTNTAGIALSPDGRTAAYVASSNGKSRLWVRPLDETAARLIPGTDDAGFPFWSSDSKSIAFGAGDKLQRVELAGGAPLTICEAATSARGGFWNSEGQIIFGTIAGLFEVPAAGGTPLRLKVLAASGAPTVGYWPQMLPGGRLLYVVARGTAEDNGVYVASLAKPSEPIKLLSTTNNALYVPGGDGNGYLLWLRGSTLVAQELDVAPLRLAGEPHPVADPVADLASRMNASVSTNGLLLYGAAYPLRNFTWVDRTGKRLAEVGEPIDIGPFRLSPDGRRLSTTRRSGHGLDLWLMEVDRGVASRFTFESKSFGPVWSPDGRMIVYAHLSTPLGLFSRALNGAGGEQSLTQSANFQAPTDWSRDGRFLLFNGGDSTQQEELWVLPFTPDGRAASSGQAKRYGGGQFQTRDGRFSPDMRLVGYESEESGQYEIYVDAFPEPHGKVQVSTKGGTRPAWGPTGRELFYVSPDSKLMAVSLKVGTDSLEPSAPRELFQLPILEDGVYPYDVAPDGQRFLIPGTPQQAGQALTVIVNWPALLKKGTAAP
jgi:serine/threonine protein kinase